VADSTVAVDFNKAFNGKRSFTAKVAFYAAVVVNIFSKLCRIIFREVSHTDIRVYARSGTDILRSPAADAIDISKSDLNALVTRQIDSCYTRHGFCTSKNSGLRR
jgi:hypothetical protein